MGRMAWPYERRVQALDAAGRILRGEPRPGDESLVAEATLHYGSLPDKSKTVPRWDHDAAEKRRLERRAAHAAFLGKPVARWCVPCRHAGPGQAHECASRSLCPCRHCDPAKPMGPPGSITCVLPRTVTKDRDGLMPFEARCLICGKTQHFESKWGPRALHAAMRGLGWEDVAGPKRGGRDRVIWAHVACVDRTLEPGEAVPEAMS